jgi:hypothetical protein
MVRHRQARRVKTVGLPLDEIVGSARPLDIHPVRLAGLVKLGVHTGPTVPDAGPRDEGAAKRSAQGAHVNVVPHRPHHRRECR